MAEISSCSPQRTPTDCIEAYSEALKSLDLQEHARLLNIGRGEKHELFPSDADLMEFALDKNFELR